MTGQTKLLVAVPCYNEAVTIAKVVTDFRAVLPDASIVVFDNNSSDGSAQIAQEAGALVQHVPRQGKGHVVRAIFEHVDVDALIMVDGDDTYFAEDAPELLSPIFEGAADMVVGNRLKYANDDSMVPLHQFGNRWFVRMINWLFGTDYKDILSGYRVFSRRFVETIPVLTGGFEIETEMTLQALTEELPIVEIPISYRSRPPGSRSKLHPLRDSYRIVLAAAIILRDHHPLRIWGSVGVLFGLGAIGAAVLRLLNYFMLTALSDALLSGLILLLTPLSLIAFGVGLSLNAINTRFREMKQIMQRNKTL